MDLAEDQPSAYFEIAPHRKMGNTVVYGVGVDANSRCSHYHTLVDVIAIEFACCNKFYACIRCHQELAEHEVQRWTPAQFDRLALLCGACGQFSSIEEYLAGGEFCPTCKHALNPGCRLHHHYYFEV